MVIIQINLISININTSTAFTSQTTLPYLGCSNQVCGEKSISPQTAEDVWHEVQDFFGCFTGAQQRAS